MKTTTAGAVFESIEKITHIEHFKYEIQWQALSDSRSALREIYLQLIGEDSDSTTNILREIWFLLSEWLTVPIKFDEETQKNISRVFGSKHQVKRTLGLDIAATYERLEESLEKMTTSENPAQLTLIEILKEQKKNKLDFRIYCKRKSKIHYNKILENSDSSYLTDNNFLCSERDYRYAHPFDTVVKFGPLTKKGWERTPSALRTAPRFSRLYQVIWAGCADDDGFGTDAILTFTDGSKSSSGNLSLVKSEEIPWRVRTIEISHDEDEKTNENHDEDDLRLLAPDPISEPARPAVFIQTDENNGHLAFPNSTMLIFDPKSDEDDAFHRRSANDGLEEGMFIVTHNLDPKNDDFKKISQLGKYNEIWRNILKEEWRSDPLKIEIELRRGGIDLADLPAAIGRWIDEPDQVIHAPQSRDHFVRLIETLWKKKIPVKSSRAKKFATEAWREIAASRGEAIQAGVEAHTNIDEYVIELIQEKIALVRDKISNQDTTSFKIYIKQNSNFEVYFLKISAIEFGYNSPDHLLKKTISLTEAEQWRA